MIPVCTGIGQADPTWNQPWMFVGEEHAHNCRPTQYSLYIRGENVSGFQNNQVPVQRVN